MIRRNFLTDADAAQKYIDGVRMLKDPAQFPWPGQDGLSIYDSFVFWHHQSMMLMTPPSQNDRNAAHSGPAFLPWHRYFLVTFEGFLRRATGDTEFRIPYWDWTADAELSDPSTSPIWSNANLGQFARSDWRVRLEMDLRTGDLRRTDRSLQRALGGGRLLTRTGVRAVVRDQAAYDTSPFNSSSSGGLRNLLEGWVGEERIHNSVHVWTGGDMSLSSSPNDPVFFLHHCNVDRIWAAWQERHRGSPYLPDMSAPETLQFHRIDDALYSIYEDTVTPGNMVDYKQYYEYDTISDIADLEV
ncbi:tyrosinase family protein [Nitrosospira sp. Nsp1]|uniref:tyrosinase family protein n=1 Tax=Nitrosospira sp. Nsp1 TaxID=136547 RepID=UPI000883815A|nr:tyrosinase family protein [Nitrosospira sp. Nsp1]SCX46307.1 tyrosinase [Nitrosospira sp. Nsp1]